MKKFLAVEYWVSLLSIICGMASANVVLIGNNVTLSFDDIEANFAPAIEGSGECGVLYVAKPLDACSDLTNEVQNVSNKSSPFVLIVRGGCTFEDKVRKAQKAGFHAAIVYDNEDDGVLVASNNHFPWSSFAVLFALFCLMSLKIGRLNECFILNVAGNSAGIIIHAVFVSRASGEKLKNYAGSTYMELWLIASFENSAWSIVAISFISLLAMSAVLATCFFVRRHHIRREAPRASRVGEFHGMSRRLVKAMPSLIFTAVLEDNSTSRACAICLEDYSVGEKLRILPCRHKFHAFCVDSWLTTWRTFCPVCKHDARTSTGDPPASESTPLLSSSPASVVSSSVLSSFRSSLASSSALHIPPAVSRSPSISHIHSVTSNIPSIHSVATTPHIPQSLKSYQQSSPLSVSQSTVDLRHASSQRSHGSYLLSSHSLGYPSISPLNSRYMSPYLPSPSNASPSLVGSFSHQPHALHCSESAASFSPFASAQSLPEC